MGAIARGSIFGGRSHKSLNFFLATSLLSFSGLGLRSKGYDPTSRFQLTSSLKLRRTGRPDRSVSPIILVDILNYFFFLFPCRMGEA